MDVKINLFCIHNQFNLQYYLPEVWERAREPYEERRFSRRFQKSNLYKNRIFVKFDFWERRENRHFTYVSLARSQTPGRSTVYS
jgi:hypothetical protein